MIVTHFLEKAYRKITEKPVIDKDEIYRQMKKAEYDARRAAARPTIAKLDSISTPHDGAKLMARMGTISDLEAALRPKTRASEGCDMEPMNAIGRFA